MPRKKEHEGTRPQLGLRRSWRLLNAFRNEAVDPQAFGLIMAEDTVDLLSKFIDLNDKKIVDVGGGSGYVSEALRSKGADAFTVEYDEREMTLGEHGFAGGMRGDGRYLPIRTNCVDLSYSSNVVEHVDGPSLMLHEMVRIVRPGGIIYIAFTNWLSPWGGHETSPLHYLGGERSAKIYERRYGVAPKNFFGKSLFKLHVKDVLYWAASIPEVRIESVFPRYYPQWTYPIVRVPFLREFVTWNLVLVLRKVADG